MPSYVTQRSSHWSKLSGRTLQDRNGSRGHPTDAIDLFLPLHTQPRLGETWLVPLYEWAKVFNRPRLRCRVNRLTVARQ
jgi:hypothetical protein